MTIAAMATASTISAAVVAADKTGRSTGTFPESDPPACSGAGGRHRAGGVCICTLASMLPEP
ncbi:MAG TPA: hypothetical protein VHO01_08225 [Jatrophihabitans sp.]|nr:hypothetical protein [Jatrophihabitans sp.]